MSKWLKRLVFGIWGLLLIPPIGASVEKWFAENILSEPNATARTMSEDLTAIGELRWFKFALVFMTGMVIGVALESTARRSGERKAFELRSLGYKFGSLSGSIRARATSGWPDNARDLKPAIMSVFVTARKFGLWVPDERIYELPDASFLCEYLSSVGTLLEQGRPDEASREALSWKPFLDRAQASRVS